MLNTFFLDQFLSKDFYKEKRCVPKLDVIDVEIKKKVTRQLL